MRLPDCTTNLSNREFYSRRLASIGSGFARWNGSSYAIPSRWAFFVWIVAIVLIPAAISKAESASDIIFQIGRPDARAAEFRFGPEWEKMYKENGDPIFRYTVGKNMPYQWPFMHVSTRDFHAAGKKFTLEIEFDSDMNYDIPLNFVIGICFVHETEPSLINIKVNGVASEPKRQPTIKNGMSFDAYRDTGSFESTIIEIPAGAVKAGKNYLTITLEDGSWFFYDYLALREKPQPLERIAPDALLKEFMAGPMKDAKKILFVVRKPGNDPHWYANFGYYALDDSTHPFPLGSGAKLCILNTETKEVQTILEDKTGSIRDPQIHYDGKKAIFSYLPGGTKHFNLYEIDLDGSNLKQLTSGEWDDIEPTYLPNDDIIFCSSRSKRWVQCWLTHVATLHRCGPNGENLHELSANVEQDNTPWVLPNGQVLYMRWEYVDRSQVHYHHLWTMNPDGTRQMVYYGNLHPEIVMLGAKPIPNSDKIVAIFSPGHGIREHYGRLTVVDPRGGPDDLNNARSITQHYNHADPWPFSDNAFMVAEQARLDLVDGDGFEQQLYMLPEDERKEGFWVHEPRPIITKEREAIIADQTDPTQDTGRLVLVDVYEGRKMEGVKRGSIKELLVLETLPEPIHFNGGMDQISNGGTFTLERIVGTVPVSPEGSASMELPALRSFLFVAMDHEGKPVKRMHSFTCVMPGETTTCIGCHENRTQTPDTGSDSKVFKALAKSAIKPKPIDDIPDVFDFPRDIQPILDKHCVSCHDHDRMDGGINLSGDWTPMFTFSYTTLTYRNMFGDNRNRAQSNFAPYEIGSSASKLMKLVESKHEGVELSPHEMKMLRFWLDVGANYAGTYAANSNGLFGWIYYEQPVKPDEDWAETRAMSEAITNSCDSCHTQEKNMRISHSLSDNAPARFHRNNIFNLSFPENSRILKGPLAKEAGGSGTCAVRSGKTVFSDKNDENYQKILAGIERGREYMTKESSRFGVEPFYANWPYTREMIRYGVLPKDHDPKSPINPYETDRMYWEKLWYTQQR